MEVFHGARLVMLRCCPRRGMYLSAEDDRTGVSLRRGRRAAANVLWSARTAASADGEAAILLFGCYGLFLAVSDHTARIGTPDAVEAQQRALAIHPPPPPPPPPDMLWQGIWKDDKLLIRNCTGSFLRGNGRYLKWRRDVTVAADNGSSMHHWAVEVLPVEPERPLVLDHSPLEEDKAKIEELLREEKSELSLILTEINDEEQKKEDSEQKMKSLQVKVQLLNSEEKYIRKKARPGVISVELHWIGREIEVAYKALHCYAKKAEEAQFRIKDLKCQEVDKMRQIQKLKWKRDSWPVIGVL